MALHFLTTARQSDPGAGSGPPRPYAARRWARAVAAILGSVDDPRTITSWARWVGVSETSIRAYCRLAGVAPKASLDFARLLRAILYSQRTGSPFEDVLEISEPRTLMRLLVRAGIAKDHAHLDVQRFIDTQQLIRKREVLDELRPLIQ